MWITTHKEHYDVFVCSRMDPCLCWKQSQGAGECLYRDHNMITWPTWLGETGIFCNTVVWSSGFVLFIERLALTCRLSIKLDKNIIWTQNINCFIFSTVVLLLVVYLFLSIDPQKVAMFQPSSKYWITECIPISFLTRNRWCNLINETN